MGETSGAVLAIRQRALMELRVKGSGPENLHLTEMLEHRLGSDSLEFMKEHAKPFKPESYAKVVLEDCGGIVGQPAPDGQGGHWFMVYGEDVLARKLLRLDRNQDVADTVEIKEKSGIHFFMDHGKPYWFDADGLRFVGPDNAAGPDFSAHAAVLGKHTYLDKCLRLGHDEFVCMFTTQTRAERTLLHVKGEEARGFMPTGVELPHDMALVGNTVLLAEHGSAWVARVDLAGETVQPYLRHPLSCLLNSMAAGQGSRLWALFNSGHSLALCQGADVTHFARDVSDIFGESVLGSSVWPVYLGVHEDEAKSAVVFTGLLPNQVHYLEFDRSGM